MILINLLPHREAAQRRQARIFHAHLALAVLLGCLITTLVFLVFQHRIDQQRARNQFLQQEMARLDGQTQGLAHLQKETETLHARQAALVSLQEQRNYPVQLLQELALQMPEGLYLDSLKQVQQNILLTGLAQSQEQVTELLHNLDSSDWLSHPELVEITATRLGPPERSSEVNANFTISVALGRPAAQSTLKPGVAPGVSQP